MGSLNFLPFLWLSLLLPVLINGNVDRVTNLPPPPLPLLLPPPSGSRTQPFKPGVAVIVGVITTIFSITFLLLLYVKHCKTGIYVNSSRGYSRSAMVTRKDSGIDPKVIASLPIFRFKSLRGEKDGLECAVCLNRFEPDEVLRLLPKCKHAFHVECVDTWLDAHSTCPLCRYRVDPEDILLVDYQNKSLYNHDQSSEKSSSALLSPSHKGKELVNPRVSGRHSSAGERGKSLEIIVENPGKDFSRRSLDSWRSGRKSGSKLYNQTETCRREKSKRLFGNDSRKDGLLLEQQKQVENHRLEHRIVISGEAPAESSSTATNNSHDHRWSDVRSSDLLYLRSEMILSRSLGLSRRHGGDEAEEGSGRGAINGRSVSEITGMSRYRSNGRQEEEGQRHEGVVKRWLAWISQSQHQKKTASVKSVGPSDSSSSSCTSTSTSIVV